MTGYYLMHRGWLNNKVFREDEPFCKRAAWAWLIEHAEYADRQIRVGRQLVTLRRGQLSYSLRYLADAWGWNQEKVRRFLADLVACDSVVTANVTGSVTAQTLITICNYNRYQSPSHRVCDSSRDSSRADPVTNPNKERSLKNLSQPSLSPSPARAREAPPPQAPRPTPPPDAARPVLSEAGLAGLADLKISEEWKKEAAAAREAAGQPAVDMDAEARKAEDHWREHPPNNPHTAWLGRARIARPDKTNIVKFRPRQFTPEEMAAGLERALAKMRAEQAREARA